MSLDRRSFAYGLAAALLGGTAQAQVPIDRSAVDRGNMVGIPDFRRILADPSRYIRPLHGYRPERRVGNQSLVRLWADQSRLVVRRGQAPLVIHNYGHAGGGVTLSLGCAILIKDEIERRIQASGSNLSKRSPVTVLGAGIAGLAVAFILKKHGFTQIHIRADRISTGNTLTPATVSDIAGGQFDAAGVHGIQSNFRALEGRSLENSLRTAMTETLNVLFDSMVGRNQRGASIQYGLNRIGVFARNYLTCPTKVAQPARALSFASNVVRDFLSSDRVSSGLRAPEWFGSSAAADDGVVAPFQRRQEARGDPARTLRVGAVDTVLVNTSTLITEMRRVLQSDGPDGPSVRFTNSFIRSHNEIEALDASIVINCTGASGSLIGAEEDGVRIHHIEGHLAGFQRVPQGEEPLFSLDDDFRYLYSGGGYMFLRRDAGVIGGTWIKSAAPVRSVEQGRISVRSEGDAQRSERMVRAMARYFMPDWNQGSQRFQRLGNGGQDILWSPVAVSCANDGIGTDMGL